MSDILRTTLEAIRQVADAHMRAQVAREESWVALTSPSDLDGTANPFARDKVVMSVHNLTQETSVSTFSASVPGKTDDWARAPMPLYLNVHLMFAANFTPDRYADGLAALSRLIGFFQQHPCFTRDTMPGLDPQIDTIMLEFENLATADLHATTSLLGIRYQPSVFYKLRMLPFAAAPIQAAIPSTYPGS